MTTVFAVVGEHRDDPDQWLLLGDDGHYYACPDPAAPPTPLSPPDDVVPGEWTLDPVAAALVDEQA